MSRILLYCPLHPEYNIRPQTLNSIMSLTWSGLLTVAFGRSPNTDHYLGAYNILPKMKEAVNLMLNGGYDYLLTVEADMIVPETAIYRLHSFDADVAYGVYCSRVDRKWLVFTDVWPMGGTRMRREVYAENWGRGVPSVGIGWGCTLIKRHVLEEIPMRVDVGGQGVDWCFAVDCKEKRYNQITDLGLVCGHMVSPKEIIYPDINQPDLCRTEVL